MSPGKATPNGNASPVTSNLENLHSSIGSALNAYKSASTDEERSAALASISTSSRRLSNAAVDPLDAFSDFTFAPLGNAAVRAALACGLIDALSTDEWETAEDVAKHAGAELGLTVRLLRALAALDMIEAQHCDDGNSKFRHSRLSSLYLDGSRRAWALWMWDVMVTASSTIGTYLEKFGPRTPTASAESPFNFAYGKTGADMFDVVGQIGKKQLLIDAMGGSSTLCARDAIATYAFDKLEPGDDDVVLVDVGGGNGETLSEIRAAYPSLKGKMVLQDRESVVKRGVVEGLEVDVQPYDFFNEEQPVKGAAAYFYQRIFHDWSDENAKVILRNLKSAMSQHSKLIISDVVIPDRDPHPRKVLRDINMMLVAGTERSERQWHELLSGEGFELVQVHGLSNSNNSVIEAKLA